MYRIGIMCRNIVAIRSAAAIICGNFGLLRISRTFFDQHLSDLLPISLGPFIMTNISRTFTNISRTFCQHLSDLDQHLSDQERSESSGSTIFSLICFEPLQLFSDQHGTCVILYSLYEMCRMTHSLKHGLSKPDFVKGRKILNLFIHGRTV